MARVTILNETRRPDDEVERLAHFVLDRLDLSRSLAIRFSENDCGGYAAERGRHRFPKWAGRSRFAIKASIWPDGSTLYGRTSVCGHARMYGRIASAEWERLYDQGVRKLGRWPLRRIDTWQEWAVWIVAHEAMHVVQYDRKRRSISEVHCEEFAAQMLDEYRSSRQREEGFVLYSER